MKLRFWWVRDLGFQKGLVVDLGFWALGFGLWVEVD